MAHNPGTSASAEEHVISKNAAILENILTFCPLQCLKSCSLVSKVWRDEAWKSMEKYAQVNISPENKILDFLASSKCYEVPGKHQAGHVLYRNFRFQQCYMKLSNFEQFWSQWGIQVKTLALVGCEFPCLDDFRQVFKHCPNMTTIEISSVNINQTDGPWLLASSCEIHSFVEHRELRRLTIKPRAHQNALKAIKWIDFLGHLPSLEILRIHINGDVNRESCDMINDIFSSIKTIREKRPDILNLNEVTVDAKNWNIFHAISSELLQVLSDSSLKFKTLFINIAVQQDLSSLSHILNAQRSSLRKLEVKNFVKKVREDSLQSCSEELQNLRDLRMYTNPFLSLAFLKFTPNLETLVLSALLCNGIYLPRSPFLNFPRIYGVRLECCIELEITGYNMDVQILINLLPNLERLKMNLYSKEFALVCSGWPRLTSLDICDGSIDESDLTGLDPQTVSQVNEKCKILGEKQRILNRKAKALKQHGKLQKEQGKILMEKRQMKEIMTGNHNANISDLKQLRSFYLRSGSCTLSHCTALYWCQQASTLPTLYIDKSKLEKSIPWNKLFADKNGRVEYSNVEKGPMVPLINIEASFNFWDELEYSTYANGFWGDVEPGCETTLGIGDEDNVVVDEQSDSESNFEYLSDRDSYEEVDAQRDREDSDKSNEDPEEVDEEEELY